MQGMTYEQGIAALIDSYYQLYPYMPQIPVKLHLSSHMSQTSLSLRPDFQGRWNKNDLNNIDDLNGQMILPIKFSDPINLLISVQKIQQYTEDGSMTWVGTLAHELTHAIDYYQYSRKLNLTTYDPLLETDQNLMFQMWSEYHAKRLGYSFLGYYLNIDSINRDDRILHIINNELPMQEKYCFDSYHRDSNAVNQLNAIMSFLGRYSVWSDLFPDTFSVEHIKGLFHYNPWMYKAFDFLYRHGTLDDYFTDADDMRAILRENWSFL